MAPGETVKGFAGKASGQKSGKAGLVALLAVMSGIWVLSGCAGIADSQPPGPQAAVKITPATLSFSTPAVGQQAVQTATVTNTSSSPVSITSLSSSSSQFSTSGVTLPFSLAAGESAKFQVAFRSSAVGTVSGTLSATTSHGGHSGPVKLTGGSGGSSQLSLSSSSLKYGNVLVDGSSTQAITVQNPGQSEINLSALTVSGAGFSVSGTAVPATIPAGQSVTLEATFAPAVAGSVKGSLTITSNAQNPSVSVALSGTGVAESYTMALSPRSVSFGSVNVGGRATQTVQLSNTGNASVTITQVSATGAGISVSAPAGPATLAPSQSLPITITYAPTAAGSVAGAVTVSNSDGVNCVAAVTATGVQAALSVTPATVGFGPVVTGKPSSAHSIQLKNSGSASLTVSAAEVSGAGFSASGLTFPLTLTPGQSGTLNVAYTPSAAGAATGTISIVSSAPNSPTTVALSGTGAAPSYAMSLSPASVSFGNVNAGSSAAQTVTLSNTGNSSITVAHVSATGTGISVGGPAAGTTLAPSESVALSVTYSPTAPGAATGSISVSNSQGVSVADAVSGTGVQAGLSIAPASVSFGSVATGTTNSQTIQVSNTGTATLAISQATISGAGFSLSGLSLPLSLAPAHSASFNVLYAPTAAGAVTGALVMASNASSTPSSVALSGSGVAATNTLSVSPGSLSFGSVTDGSSASQGITVTNTGNSSVAISGVSISGTGFSILSGSGAVTLSPNQTTAISVQFAPAAAGPASGSVHISSNATASPNAIGLSGTGVAAPVPHSVALSWGASSSTVSGYNIYRSTVSGSSYSKVNSSLLPGLSYSDSAVAAGTTYYYVATAVDSSGNESVYSNEVPATIP
jgi:hypothetical protein